MNLIKQLMRFGIVGVLSTLIHACIATIMIKFLLSSQVVANCSAFVCATFFSYIAHTRYSFVASFSKKTSLRFIVVVSICFFITAILAKIAEYFNMPYQIGIVLVLSIVPIISYLLHRFWTYKCITIK